MKKHGSQTNEKQNKNNNSHKTRNDEYILLTYVHMQFKAIRTKCESQHFQLQNIFKSRVNLRHKKNTRSR